MKDLRRPIAFLFEPPVAAPKSTLLLLVAGPGSWSLDAPLRRRREAAPAPRTSEHGHPLPTA
jgi:hypothetical protein